MVYKAIKYLKGDFNIIFTINFIDGYDVFEPIFAKYLLNIDQNSAVVPNYLVFYRDVM